MQIALDILVSLLASGIYDLIKYFFSSRKTDTTPASYFLYVYNPSFSDYIDNKELERELNRQKLKAFFNSLISLIMPPVLIKTVSFFTLLFLNTHPPINALFNPLPKISSHFSVAVFDITNNIDNLFNRNVTLTPSQSAAISSFITIVALIPTSILTDLVAKFAVKIKDNFSQTSIDTYFIYRMRTYLFFVVVIIASLISIRKNIPFSKSLGSVLIGFGTLMALGILQSNQNQKR